MDIKTNQSNGNGVREAIAHRPEYTPDFEDCDEDDEEGQQNAQLLARKSKIDNYHPDCPGCKMELQKRMQKGYPVKELLLICLLVLSNALPISSLFPYLYFMVRDFHTVRTEDIGYYAGFIGSSFMFGRFLTSVLWGIAADKYGRKPVMVTSVCSIIVFNTIFGLSSSFWMATTIRFMLGCFNGLLGPIKAYASEVCKEEHQALGLSTVGTMWAIGLIIGPAIGGFLAQPSDKYPNLFPKSSFFGRFPYFLPCICITAIAILVLATTVWLPETLHNHLPEIKKKENELELSQINKSFQQNAGSKVCQKTSKEFPLNNWPAISSIILYCFFCLYDIAYQEIFSLWGLSPKQYGGLNFTTSNLGTVLSITGFGLLVFQLFVFPLMAKKARPILIVRIPIALTIPVLILHPYISMLSGILIWVVISCASLLRNILSVTALTGMFLLINNSVPQHQRGLANGVALTGMSLFKTIGPSVAGAIFSWAQSHQKTAFLSGNQLVFFFLNTVVFLTLLMTFEPFIPQSINKPYQEGNDDCERQEGNDDCERQ